MGDGLTLQAQAETKNSLKKICDLFRITAPYIELNAAVAPKSLELEGNLEFKDGPVEFFKIDKTGTVVKFNSASIETTLEPGSAELGFKTNLFIKPTKTDPDLDCTYAFSYDILSQKLTGAGSMMSEWTNPLGSSAFLKPESIIFSNAAIQLGINIATLMPVDLGFAMEKGKIFTLDFNVLVSINPEDKSIAFKGQRERMNPNDFFTFIREGFGLNIPNVLPDIYYIDKPYVLFSPEGASVGEVEIDKGIALDGLVKIGDAIEGPMHFYFDMENQFNLHMDLDYNYRKFVMNEVRKIKPLAPIVNEVLKTLQIRKMYVDLNASKSDLNFQGKTKIDFEVFGKPHHIEFGATLDPKKIAQQLVGTIRNSAGPQISAITNKVGNALNRSKSVAAKAWGEASKFIGNAAKHTLHRQGRCDNECVPAQARKLYNPILNGGNEALQGFYNDVIDVVAQIEGENNAETVRLRTDYIGSQWREITSRINQDWENIRKDRTYVSFYLSPSSATNGGNIYRDIIDKKRSEYNTMKNKLWNDLMNARLYQNDIVCLTNRWKNTSINIERGPVELTNISNGAWSGHWIFEPVSGTNSVRIKSRWKGTYLNVENDSLVGVTNDYLPTSVWEVEKVPGTNFAKLKNKKYGTYLNNETGALKCSKILPGWHSAQWNTDILYQPKSWNANAQKDWVPGQTILVSENRRYSLIFQADGNLVLMEYGIKPLWDSASAVRGASRFSFQKDGNLVIYNSNNAAIWASGSENKNGEALYLQDDGNMVLHAPGAIVIWDTATHQNR